MEIQPAQVKVADPGMGKGLCVYARASFKAGETVELCPVISMQCPFADLPEGLKHRVFSWYSLANAQEAHTISLGFGALYSHQNPANMCYQAHESGQFLKFVAARDIDEGEELTINYDGAHGSHVSDARPREVVVSFRTVVRDTGTARGLGGFARGPIKKDEIVEISPVIPFDGEFEELPECLMTRVYDWEVLAASETPHAIALGFGSMYNHENPSNMRFEAILKGRFIRYVAVRDIEEGEELTINYSGYRGSHEAEDDNWFDRTGITPIKDDE